MRIRQKMFLGSAFLAVLPVLITAYFTSKIAGTLGQQALTESARSHISSIRDTKKSQIEGYFRLVNNQIQVYADDSTVVSAMKDFKDAFPRFTQEAALKMEDGPPIPQQLPMGQFRESLKSYYLEDFSTEYKSANHKLDRNLEEMVKQLNDNSVALQYYYIANNPNPLGTKEEFRYAADASGYTRFHKNYHHQINDFRQRFNIDDVYLIDIDTGNVIYSSLKNIDFATSLVDGAFAKTGLSEAFAAVRNAPHGQVNLVDFANYLPEYETPEAFMSTPIFDGRQRIGALVFRLTIDTINEIMTYNKAWRVDESGRTGETYIVASDGTMRNDSRMLIEDKERYLAAIQDSGLEPESIQEIT